MKHNSDQTAARHAADAVDDVADGIRSAAHSVKTGVQNAAQTVRDAAGHATEAVEHAYDQAGRRARASLQGARSMERGFESCVRDNPKSSLLIAAAIGAVFGALYWRKRS